MRTVAVFCVLFFYAASLNAGIDLRGTITKDNGEPLEETLLFLKSNPAMRCSTDASGAFRLSDNAWATVNQKARDNGGIRIRPVGNGSGLLVRSYGMEKIKAIEMFKADGRRVASAHFTPSDPVEHFVPYCAAASGVHFVKVATARETKVFQTLPSLGTSSLSIKDFPAAIPQSGIAKRSDSFIDTLVVYRYEYRTTLIGLTSYQQTDMQITPLLSNTYNNCSCAPLPTWNGMVKITAQRYREIDTCDFEMGQLCDTIWGKKDGHTTSDLEQPVHTVRFTHNFLIDTMEISQGEYDSVMKKNYGGYVTPTKWSVLYGKGNKYPAYAVSWDDAVLFCNARSKRDALDTAYTYTGITGTPGSQSKLVNVSFQLFKTGYRLPTEAEWEYCARAGMREDFWWSKNWQDYKNVDTIEGVDGYATWAQNSWDLGSGKPGFGTMPVDSAELGTGGNTHNWYLLKGMYGNVSEWCNDLSGSYAWGTFIDPTGPEWTSGNTMAHVIRGGNWGSTIFYLRGANRYFSTKGDDKDIFIGFRTVRVIGGEM